MSGMSGEGKRPEFEGEGIASLVRKNQIRGDTPLFNRRQLPNKPSRPGNFDTWMTFLGLVKNAYDLGVPPPAEPSPESMMQWKALVSPWAEGQILNKTDLPGKKSKTWDI